MLSLFTRGNPYSGFQNRSFLVVDWLTTGVVLSEVSVNNESPAVVRSRFEKWSAEFNTLTAPDDIGKWLRTICESEKYPTAAVAISVPRRDLSLKLLELPNVSDDELGPLVALQVESRVQATGQAVAWDCLPHPAKSEDTHRCVMLATIPIHVSNAIRLAAESAGWSNLVLTSGDLLTSNLAPSGIVPWQLHVQANPAKLELIMCHHGLPLSSYATAMPTDSAGGSNNIKAATAIVQSMSGRLLAASPKSLQNEDTSCGIVVAGSFASQLVNELRTESTKVQSMSIESTLVDDRTPRAMSVALALVSHTSNRIDFLRPRSADGRTANRRQQLLRIAATIAAVIVFVSAGLWMWQRSLQNELAQLEAQRLQLQQFIDRGQDTVDKWSFVSRWQNDTIQAASEIRKFASLLPSRERMIVTRLQLENVVDSENSMLRIDGLAQSAEDVLQMNSSILKESARYDLRPQGIEPSPAGSVFASQFRIEAVLRDAASKPGVAAGKESR